jgi:hypothetical protein
MSAMTHVLQGTIAASGSGPSNNAVVFSPGSAITVSDTGESPLAVFNINSNGTWASAFNADTGTWASTTGLDSSQYEVAAVFVSGSNTISGPSGYNLLSTSRTFSMGNSTSNSTVTGVYDITVREVGKITNIDSLRVTFSAVNTGGFDPGDGGGL